jgi:hypothetical protein
MAGSEEVRSTEFYRRARICQPHSIETRVTTHGLLYLKVYGVVDSPLPRTVAIHFRATFRASRGA